MIINGGSRSNGGFFTRHLMRADENERVNVTEIRGLAAQDVRGAFREMKAVASGTKAKNYFYHANINPRESETLTAEQWNQAVDTLERSLGLTDQPRFVIEHEKDGRTHRHIVWSRIDADSMTAISDSLTYRKHERAAREIEHAFGHEPVESVLVKDRETPRPDRNPQDWESFRGQDSKLDPKVMKTQVTALWQAADSGHAFVAGLAQHGYILARGDRRDFCLIDAAGDEHSLARRISGVKAADIRSRLGDVDAAALPSVAEARELARQRPDEAGGGLTPELATFAVTIDPEELSQPDDRFGAGMAGADTPGAEVLPEPVWDLPVDPLPAEPSADIVPPEPISVWSQQPAGPVLGEPEMGFFGRIGRAVSAFLGSREQSPTIEPPEVLPPPEPEPTSTGASLGESAERALTAFFGEGRGGETSPAFLSLATDEPPAGATGNAFASVHRATIQQAQPPDSGPSMVLTEKPQTGTTDLSQVHNETITQATADAAVIEVEEATGGRFQRLQSWWTNMRDHFVEWRGQLRESVDSYLRRGDEPTPTPIPPPEQNQPEPQGPEIQ
jgi:hypothetical protein